MLIYMRSKEGAVMEVYDAATQEFNEKNGWEVFDYAKDHAEKLAVKRGDSPQAEESAEAESFTVTPIKRGPGRPRS